MKNKYNFFLIFFISTPFLLNAQGNNEINWCVFSSGFGGQTNSSSIITTMAGEPIAGITKNDATKFTGGFLSGYLFSGEPTSLDNAFNNQLPTEYKLYQNYPNPFNPTTKIKFSVPENQGRVTLKVFDILGNEIAELVNEEKSVGNYEVEFNAAKYGISSGIYFYRIHSDQFTNTKKLMLVK
jgi:hypothetical protein